MKCLLIGLCATGLCALALRGDEPAKLKIYPDVQYLIATPTGCSSWMLARSSLDAYQLYRNRDNCGDAAFSVNLSKSKLFTYIGTVNITGATDSTGCCVKVLMDGSSGWVMLDLVTLAAGQRAVYDADVAKEQAEAEEQAKKDATPEGRLERYERLERERLDRLERLEDERIKREAKEAVIIRLKCAALYRDTVDKKVKDLTVGEEQQVRACQALDLYPPR